ncbi:hypothetical protein Ait01nite_068050 [Actinoplanes italicus]|nr:hypothetical protein Ait01nite_068050 [Actinoplanes italicus]
MARPNGGTRPTGAQAEQARATRQRGASGYARGAEPRTARNRERRGAAQNGYARCGTANGAAQNGYARGAAWRGCGRGWSDDYAVEVGRRGGRTRAGFFLDY